MLDVRCLVAAVQTLGHLKLFIAPKCANLHLFAVLLCKKQLQMTQSLDNCTIYDFNTHIVYIRQSLDELLAQSDHTANRDVPSVRSGSRA